MNIEIKSMGKINNNSEIKLKFIYIYIYKILKVFEILIGLLWAHKNMRFRIYMQTFSYKKNIRYIFIKLRICRGLMQINVD